MAEDTAALEQEALAQLAEQEDAFKKRFPPPVFAGVARALKIRDRATFARLVRSLRVHFYAFYVSCQSKPPSRDEETKHRLKELRDAANLIASTDLWTDPWMPLSPLGETEEEQFVTMARRLATFWDEELTKRET